MLTLNTIKAQPGAHSQRRRLGRGQGSGLGATAGKGDKGQLARTGGRVRAGFEGGQMPLYRRIPKRGFKNFARRTNAVLNLVDLERAGLSDVTLESLKESGALKGRYDRLTILANGELTKAVNIKAHRISPSAQEKITKAGGKFELLVIPGKKKKAKMTKKVRKPEVAAAKK